MRKLGSVQQDVLASLKRHGSWHLDCGWLWDTPTNTMRIMDSLVRAGYARTTRSILGSCSYPGVRTIYRPTNLIPPKIVILSGGRVVDGDNVKNMLKQQHVILLKLSRDLAKQGHGADSAAQKAIGDANMLGLETADRIKETEENER